MDWSDTAYSDVIYPVTSLYGHGADVACKLDDPYTYCSAYRYGPDTLAEKIRTFRTDKFDT